MKKIISISALIAILVTSLLMFSGCRGEKINNSSKNEIDMNSSNENEVNSISTDNGKVDIKDKSSYYFVINGQKYTTENKLKDIENAGVVQDSNTAQAEIQKNTFYIGGGYFRDSATNHTVFSVIPINNTTEPTTCAEANIGGFNVENYYYKDYAGKIEIAGGISIGSTLDELVYAYGEPTEKDMRENYENLGILYKYKVGLYQYFEFEIDKKEQKVTEITWRYFEN